MDKLLEQLENILSAESGFHEDLLKTAKSLNEAIKSDNLELIQQHTTLYDELVYKIVKLEENRIECAIDLGCVLGIKENIPKMNSLLKKLPESWRIRLLKMQQQLKKQIIDLSKINISNNILLQESISFVNSNILMFQQASTRSYRYGDKGKPASVSSGPSLINRVA